MWLAVNWTLHQVLSLGRSIEQHAANIPPTTHLWERQWTIGHADCRWYTLIHWQNYCQMTLPDTLSSVRADGWAKLKKCQVLHLVQSTSLFLISLIIISIIVVIWPCLICSSGWQVQSLSLISLIQFWVSLSVAPAATSSPSLPSTEKAYCWDL